MINNLQGIELRVVVKELQVLLGSRVQKIYQPSKNEIVIYFYKNQDFILRITDKIIHLTKYKRKNPITPSQYAMLLRKNLMNSRIKNIKQIESERILRIEFDNDFSLIIELFSKGNIILLKEDVIKYPLKIQVWSTRKIKPNEKYELPPKKINLFKVSYSDFKKILMFSDKQIVKVLAVDLGISGVYAEEICLNAGINKTLKGELLNDEETRKIYDEFKKLLQCLEESKGYCVYDYNKMIDVVPIKLNIYENKKFKEFPTFNEALDYYFTEYQKKGIKQERMLAYENKINQLKTILKNQEENIELFKKKSEENRRKGEFIKENLYLLENLLKSLRNAKQQYSWEKIKHLLENEKEKGVPEALMIKELVPEEGRIILDSVPEISLTLNDSIPMIMNDFFEKAKKNEEKIINAQNKMLETRKKISEFENRKKFYERESEKELPKIIQKKKKEWYENYKWFFTSNNNLVVSGKDENTNIMLLKKHLEGDDLVFHTEITGSPFTLLKNGSSSNELEKREAASFTASNSKAWSLGYGSVEVFYVKPFQITKTAPSGEYIRRGSFVIKGKKNFIKDLKIELAIGVSNDFKVIGGPFSAVKKHSIARVIIAPGGENTGDIAKKVKQIILERVSESLKEKIKNIPLEEFQKWIPGKSRIVF